MTRYLVTMLILLAMSASSFGQKIVYDKPDFILHIASADSSDGFGAVKAFGRFNNDCYDDLVVLAPHAYSSTGKKVGKAFLYYGSKKGIDTTKCSVVEGLYPVDDSDKPDLFNRALHSLAIGDFNNDGYADLAIGTPWYQKISLGSSLARGYAMVFLSKADGSGLDFDKPIEFLGYTPIGNFAFTIRTGDVNGDKIDDLIISSLYDEGFYEGRIFIYFGGNTFDNSYDKILKTPGKRQGLSCSAVADVDGDGFDDIIGSDWYSWNFENQKIHVWLGDKNLSEYPSFSRDMPFKTVKFAGDLNRDHFADIIVSYEIDQNPPEFNPNLFIIRGAKNFDIENDLEIVLHGHHTNVTALCDINQNKVNDIFIDSYDQNGNSISYVLSGDENGYINVSDTLIKFADTDIRNGSSVWGVIPADMNGDGIFEYYANSQMKPFKDVIFIYNAPFPAIAIIYPNTANIEWKTGKHYTITWDSRGEVGPSVKIELYQGNLMNRVITNSTENDGSFTWTVDPMIPEASNYRVKISSTSNSEIYGFSDIFFHIKQIPVLKITYPDSAGIKWYWGETYSIEWQSWREVGEYVRLELFKDDQFFRIINFSSNNDGSYQYKIISDDFMSGENFKVKITSVRNDSIFDFSNHSFGIFKAVNVDEKPFVNYTNKLHPNYPNPFNAATKIRYEISRASDVQIRIYNLLGKVVRTMVSPQQSAGAYELTWDGKDDQNRLAAGGIFILELKTEGVVEREKITFLK